MSDAEKLLREAMRAKIKELGLPLNDDWFDSHVVVDVDEENTGEEDAKMSQRYKIIRFYHPSVDRENEVQRTGLTLEEAQEHCNDPATRKDNEFFDGYTEE